MFGSANRDEREWQHPERFDIQRKAAEQLAFGHGEHLCVGLPLARLEIRALLTALAKRVKGFEILQLKRGINNMLRGLETLKISVHWPARAPGAPRRQGEAATRPIRASVSRWATRQSTSAAQTSR